MIIKSLHIMSLCNNIEPELFGETKSLNLAVVKFYIYIADLIICFIIHVRFCNI